MLDELRDVKNFELKATIGMKLLFFGHEMFATFVDYFRRDFLIFAFTMLFKPGTDAQKRFLGDKIIELAIPTVSIRI